MEGFKLLVVAPIDIESFEEKGGPVVAVDTVQAGEGDVVLLVGGSSSRQTAATEGKPVDSAVVAIVDSVNLRGKRIYEKFGEKDK
jgi:ethanolamine utilization protein EutN/carbon dioxide concentrating mechanism protein CcmL